MQRVVSGGVPAQRLVAFTTTAHFSQPRQPSCPIAHANLAAPSTSCLPAELTAKDLKLSAMDNLLHAAHKTVTGVESLRALAGAGAHCWGLAWPAVGGAWSAPASCA